MRVGDLVETAEEPTVETPVVEPTVTTKKDNPDDPYDSAEETEETSDVITEKVFKWSGKGGLFSTWRERHVFLRGFRSGFGTKLFEKFPECPSMWKDDAHYYESGQELGYVIKIGIQISAAWMFAQLGLLTVTGGIDVGETIALNKDNIAMILKMILGMVGQ